MGNVALLLYLHSLVTSRFVAPSGLPHLRRLGLCLIAILCFVVDVSVCNAHEELAVIIGRSASGQLKMEPGFAVLPLEASVFPGMIGFATGESGFHSAAVDEPDEDMFMLSPAADTRFVLLARSPGMEVLNDHGSAFMTNGESFYMGPAAFDTHPLWNITNGIPGEIYSVTLKVIDVNGIYTESDPVPLFFTPDPPVLTLTNSSPGFVTLSWEPNTTGFRLQSSTNLAAAAWTNAPSGVTNPITLPASNLFRFYRVAK